MPAQSASPDNSTRSWAGAAGPCAPGVAPQDAPLEARLAAPLETAGGTLRERLHEVALDRSATSDALVLETGRVVLDWVVLRPDRWTWIEAGRELETGLAEWIAEQAWRATAALWLDALREAWHAGSVTHPCEAREYLTEELGLWLCAREADERGAADSNAPRKPWNGAPLGSGRRLADRGELAMHAASILEAHEVVVLNAFSNTVAVALERAWRAGKHPQVIVAESLPTLEGRRMARRLSRAGIAVSVCYDAALHSALERADRVWLGTESIGASAFLARVGTRSWLEEAQRREVPVQLLATSDKLMPAGELARPAWPERDTWLLWDDAPENVKLETQCFELAPLELVEHLITECGRESPVRLGLRALRATRPAPCGRAERAPVHT